MELEFKEKLYYTRSSKGKIGFCREGNYTPEEYVKNCQKQGYDVIKASYKIIDILEVGDYVNGCYVSNKRASVNEHLGGYPKGIGIIKCNAYFNQGNYNDCKFEWIEEKDIKSIITKEQMEQMAYKVVE